MVGATFKPWVVTCNILRRNGWGPIQRLGGKASAAGPMGTAGFGGLWNGPCSIAAGGPFLSTPIAASLGGLLSDPLRQGKFWLGMTAHVSRLLILDVAKGVQLYTVIGKPSHSKTIPYNVDTCKWCLLSSFSGGIHSSSTSPKTQETSGEVSFADC